MAQSRIYLGNQAGGAGSPDVTINLSGQAVTCSAGTLGVSHSNALSGQAATASAGTLTPVLSFGLTGTAVTASAGTLSYESALALLGQALTASAGTISPALSLALAGQGVTASAGTLIAFIVADAAEGVGGGIYNGPGTVYRKPTKDEISRLQRLLNFDSIRETKRFIRENPEPARMALAVFEITADPDALIEAVLGNAELMEKQRELRLAADREALALMRQRIQEDTVELLLILAAMEW